MDFGLAFNFPKIEPNVISEGDLAVLKAKKNLSLKKNEIIIKFILSVAIPATGAITIEFIFGSSGSITKIYPHCRSLITLNSQLYSIIGDNNGDISC